MHTPDMLTRPDIAAKLAAYPPWKHFNVGSLRDTFVARYRDDIRFEFRQGSWFHWRDDRWVSLDKNEMFEMLYEIGKQAYAESNPRDRRLIGAPLLRKLEKALRMVPQIVARISPDEAPTQHACETVYDNPPELIAYPHGETQLRVWCPYCVKWHYHGNDVYDHRHAHCLSEETSALYRRGYDLVPPVAEHKQRRRVKEAA